MVRWERGPSSRWPGRPRLMVPAMGAEVSPVTGGKAPLLVERSDQANDYNDCYSLKKIALKLLHCVAVQLRGGRDWVLVLSSTPR